MTRAERLEEIRSHTKWTLSGHREIALVDDVMWLMDEVERLGLALLTIQNHTAEGPTDEIARKALNP